MSRLTWYWHRLRAMSPAEMALHARKKFRQFIDARVSHDSGSHPFDASGAFPLLPAPERASSLLRLALKRNAENILAGKWKAFGHLDLKVDDPPKWHRDYLAGMDLPTNQSAFQLNHRALPGGADIKLIWELSRWHELVRLAMAAYVLDDPRAAGKCVDWLEDWVEHNPPYRGWNWTSALEAGLRLIQFTWIDALLAGWGTRIAKASPSTADLTAWSFAETTAHRLEGLRREILPAHVRFVWRHRSFGSSANNHLLGELTGLIVATVRWPELDNWVTSLGHLEHLWECEVLDQFAEDGGNREQALNYHLFSFEFCWQAMMALRAAGPALRAAGRPLWQPVQERLQYAGSFFVNVQVDQEPWDYGDSDSAFATPFALDSANVAVEWRHWMSARDTSPMIDYWLGAARDEFRGPFRESPSVIHQGGPQEPVPGGAAKVPKEAPRIAWVGYPKSGQWVCRAGRCRLRWDLSPLGYLTTAAHGHLDAQHLSLWLDEIALVIDPGTGAYYSDRHLRNWLSSRAAHNGPCPLGQGEWPRRLGSFLWEEHHDPPPCENAGEQGLLSTLKFPGGTCRRTIELTTDGPAIVVSDTLAEGSFTGFSVRWQFAPESLLAVRAERQFQIERRGVRIEAKVSADWAEVCPVTEQSHREKADPDHPLAGLVSPAFRKAVWAPYLKLVARPGDRPCVFTTIFSVPAHL